MIRSPRSFSEFEDQINFLFDKNYVYPIVAIVFLLAVIFGFFIIWKLLVAIIY